MTVQARSGPPTITYLEQGRRYQVLGQPMVYLGKGALGHWFEHIPGSGRSGIESHSDAYMAELLSTGRVTPLGPA